VLGPEENHGGESRNPEPGRIRARGKTAGRAVEGVGTVGLVWGTAPSDDSDAIEVDPEDEET
jgi:hypothetical protein